MLDLNALVIFAKVVEAGSFIGAARLLDIPKSTISRRVAELEQDIGVRLIQRTTRNLSLTEAGAAFYQRCMDITRAIEDARASVAQHQVEPKGRLRVTASGLFGEKFLSPHISGYLARYPKVEVELFITSRKVDLVSEGFDLAFRVAELEPSSLIARKIAPSAHYICASPAYLAERGAPSSPGELSEHACAVYSPNRSVVKWEFDGPGDQHESVTVTGPLLLNSFNIALDVVLDGGAIGNLPAVLVCDAIRSGKLTRVLPAWSQPYRWIHALYPSRNQLVPTVRTFLDFVSDKLSTISWLLDDDAAC